MFFNRFYVGLTRASKKVIIVETDPLDNDIRDIFLPETIIFDYGAKKRACLSFVSNYSDFSSFFENDYSAAVWKEKAQQMFEKKDFEMAIDYISKGIRSAQIEGQSELVEEYEEIKEKIHWLKESDEKTEISRDDLPLYLESAFDLLAIDIVMDLYLKAKKNDRIEWLRATAPKIIIDNYKQHIHDFCCSKEKEYFALKAIKAYRELIHTESQN